MIEIKGLYKEYRRNTAVCDVNLIFEEGQVIGLFGDNGAGKTTLLKIMAGIIKQEKGEVIYDEKKITYSLYNDISFISEGLSVFPEWNIYQHEDFYKMAFKNFDCERFNKLIKFFSLNKDEKIKTFSKGQKAKIEIAIGFSKGAKYILMDEPFLGSDVLARVDFMKVMAALMKENDIVIIATHLLTEIEQFIDRGIFMKYGRIMGDYNSDEIAEEGGLVKIAKQLYNYDEKRINKIIEF